MIEEIAIRDLGVIAEAALPLGPGFTAITGETGAGKTMVVTALGLLLGERADSGAVRAGSAQAWVEGRWSVPSDGPVAVRVREAGGELDEPPDPSDGSGAELLLGRSVSAEGRSRAVVGGRGAPVGVLSDLGRRLVVVHGQSEQVRLRSASAQRRALDRHAGPELAAVLADYRSRYLRWRETRSEADGLVADRDRRAAEAGELRTALAEIEEADPRPGEDEELAEIAERLTNLEELRAAAARARELVSAEVQEGADVVGLLAEARRGLERAAGHDPALADLAEQLGDAAEIASEAAGGLSSYLAGLEEDSGNELEAVQERRALLTALCRRHGPTLADVLERADTGGRRLLELDGDDDRIEALTAALAEDERALEETAERIGALRRAAAERLEGAVSAELEALAMPDARLLVEVSDAGELGETGRDRVALLLRPHAGAEPRPLGRGASGGELSRVMLAIEVVLADTDPVPTFVFDEVDAGVGGAAAIEVGRRLAALAEHAQVVVVTHLAQVAAFATRHLSVVKGGDGAVTTSSVRALDGEARIAEMARLLSGLPDSEAALTHARELVEQASAAS